MLNRRNFLQTSSLLSLTPWVPGFLSKTAWATPAQKDERILVVLEMTGGNDGLNTVVPFADENYAKYRKIVRIETKDVIKLNDSLGLHPGMKAASELFDDQRLAIIPGVGYPNPNRSHFRSQAIWHSARLEALDHTGRGWLGHVCDQQPRLDPATPDAVYVGSGTVPSAIIGRRTNAIAVNSEEELILASGLAGPGPAASPDDINAFVQNSVDSSFTAAKRFAEMKSTPAVDSGGYPASRLAQKFRLLAKLIRLGGDTRIFYVTQPGYDTHAGQKPKHDELLTEFSTSLKAFLDDMKRSGLGDRVTVLAYSEFGRRVNENASAGTDHGTSGPVFVAGESVEAGILSPYPSLGELEDDDLKTIVDFRSIYASLLTNWLGVDASGPLAGKFKPLKVVS